MRKQNVYVHTLYPCPHSLNKIARTLYAYVTYQFVEWCNDAGFAKRYDIQEDRAYSALCDIQGTMFRDTCSLADRSEREL